MTETKLYDLTGGANVAREMRLHRAEDPLADPTFRRHVSVVTTEDQRARTVERLRPRWRSAAAALALLVLSALPASASRVLQSVTTPDGAYRIEVADYRAATRFDVYSTPTSGGAPRLLSQNEPSQGWDVDGFILAGRGSALRVVYRAGWVTYGIENLFAVSPSGGGPVRLNGVIDGQVLPGFAPFGGGRVTFGAEVEAAGGRVTHFLARADGSERRAGIFFDGFESGSVSRWGAR